jgi:hypothetical protein
MFNWLVAGEALLCAYGFEVLGCTHISPKHQPGGARQGSAPLMPATRVAHAVEGQQ